MTDRMTDRMIPIVSRSQIGIAAARATMSSPVVLVPTMGALHDGHRALLRRGRDLAGPGGSLVVSIFVNPLQFGIGTDLDRYPRDLARDVEICAAEGVAVIFAPLESQMYPRDQTITVHPGRVGQQLEGASRPGFFEGVLTVVLKIFNLVQPDVAVFGQKDAQQVFLVRRMVADLNLNLDIESVTTVREPDGLAAIEPEQLSVAGRPDYRAGAEPGAAGRCGSRGRGPAGAWRWLRGRARRRHRRACRRHARRSAVADRLRRARRSVDVRPGDATTTRAPHCSWSRPPSARRG